MKHLKLFFALFAMLALGVGNAWGAEWEKVTSAPSDWSGEYLIVYNNGCFNGSLTTGFDKSAPVDVSISNNKITLDEKYAMVIAKQGSVYSLKTASGYYIGRESSSSNGMDASQTWSDKYTINLTWNSTNKTIKIAGKGSKCLGLNSTTWRFYASSNAYVNLSLYKKVETSATQPTLSSIEISGDLTNKTYEEGEELDFTGLTVNATYSDDSNVDVTNDVEWSYDALVAGQTSVLVTATYQEQTTTKTIDDLTVTEHVVTPDTYDLLLNNVFFGTAAGANITAATSAKQNDVTVEIKTTSGTWPRTDSDKTRFYANNKLSFSVPAGYVIKSIKFTEPTSDKTWNGSITVNEGNYTDETKSWAGQSESVVFSLAAQNRIAKAIVTYIADVKYALNITTPSNGTLVVKEDETEVTSGAKFYEGTKLSVTATPDPGYADGVVVVKNSSDVDITSTVYADGVLTMPAEAVTISATFEQKPCTILATPVVSATTTYSTATLSWKTIANAAKYSVKIGDKEAVETTETSYEVTGLTAETEYTYQVQAIAADAQSDYCDSELAEGTFTTNAAPVVTLILKDIEGEKTMTGALNGTITLPDDAATCTKTFVGWDANENCNDAPTYAPGAEYTLTAENQTLYAVYADGEGGGNFTITKTMSEIVSANGYTVSANNTATCYTSLQLDENITLSTTGSANCGSFWNDPQEWRLYQNKSGNAIVTANNGCSLTSVKFTFTISNTGTLLDNGTAMKSGTTVSASGTSATYTVGNSGSATNGQVRITAIEVSYSKEGEYSDYSTDCAAAPTAEVEPTSVTATAAETTGKLTVTYDNVNTEDVTVALYNDAACTDAFNADWLTASLDDDKNITYTVAATTLYTERKAYIKLTAPEITGAVDPAVVVIPVTQEGKDKVFASLEALLAAITPTTEGVEVTVTLTNEVIQDFYTSGSSRNGVKLNVPYQGGIKAIEIYCNDVPAEWVKGGKLSGTITCPWKLYYSTWELCPTAWTELTYTAPPTVSSIAISGTPTKTTYIDGEEFDPAGLVVTATYTDASTETVNAALVDWTFNPEILTKGLTSVQVTATYNTLTSAAYSVDVTVNDIPTKTVAEFIAAEGGRCYLEGIVSNITNTTYGNFDLTDASDEIYIYGCLNASGESKKFATLGVKEGDKIKVIADTYELYEGTKQEAKNVQYVSHISAATITIANITMEVGETKTISATLDPAEAEVTYTIKENTAGAISLSGNTITALAEGTATITATVAEGADYLGTTKDFTVTVNPQNIATLPFAFDGGVNDIKNTLGMSQKNLGTDYGSSPKLKFDDKDDYVIIHFDERPGELTYDIKANTGNAQAFSGTFTVQESADGVTYRDLVKYTTISGSKEAKTHNCFDKDTRYIKFIFATKDNGNVALGNIKIETSVVTKVTPSVESGIFSVGAGKYVQFSTGNLQYEVGTNTWSFASEQYEVIGGAAYDGTNNTNYGMNEPGYTGKLDLFGWSSDGKFGVNPSNTDADYGTDGVNEFVDWGHLVNETGWYTLTKEEMNYILNRKKDGKKLWALATVCNMNGLILLPDNWDTSITLDYGYVPANFNYTKNQIDDAAWQTLEDAGAVFLPEGGTRVGGHGNKEQGGGPDEFDAHRDYFHVDNVNEMGYYWLNTQDTRAEYLECASFLILPGWSDNGTPNDESDDKAHAPQVWSREKRRGNSVRLVKVVEPDYTREGQGAGVYGTVCYPENIVWCDGATLYEVAGKEGNKVIFDEVTTPEAGMPYIFIADQEVINFFCGTDEAATAGEKNSLKGTFEKIDPEVEDILKGHYVLYKNIIKKCGANCGLEANRAYFVADKLENSLGAPTASQAPGRRRISLDVQSENTTTGLDNITNGENTTIKTIENGQFIIIRNGEKYNAQGVRFY